MPQNCLAVDREDRGFADTFISANEIADVLEDEALSTSDILAAFAKAARLAQAADEGNEGEHPSRVAPGAAAGAPMSPQADGRAETGA